MNIGKKSIKPYVLHPKPYTHHPKPYTLHLTSDTLFLRMFFLATFWQKIISADQWLFEKINTGLANPVFDVVMPFLRSPANWAPLYLFLLVFMLLNFKAKGAWWGLFPGNGCPYRYDRHLCI